jgi:hypothetical protein
MIYSWVQFWHCAEESNFFLPRKTESCPFIIMIHRGRERKTETVQNKSNSFFSSLLKDFFNRKTTLAVTAPVGEKRQL